MIVFAVRGVASVWHERWLAAGFCGVMVLGVVFFVVAFVTRGIVYYSAFAMGVLAGGGGADTWQARDRLLVHGFSNTLNFLYF